MTCLDPRRDNFLWHVDRGGQRRSAKSVERRVSSIPDELCCLARAEDEHVSCASYGVRMSRRHATSPFRRLTLLSDVYLLGANVRGLFLDESVIEGQKVPLN